MEQQIDALQQQLKQQEKLASLGMLSAGIAHEIQNPLNFVINFSKMSNKLLKDLIEIVKDYEDKLSKDDQEEVEDIASDLEENLSKIVEHSERAISIIQGILLVSRGKEDEFLPADVVKIVKDYVRLSYHAMRASHKGFNVTIQEDYQEGLPQMMVIPQDMSRAILNLMNNACYTMWRKSQEKGDDYKPTIQVRVAASNGQLLIDIEDNGEGMTEEVKQRLYENFFTTKPSGQGTGLGMGITKDIIENKHHGSLTFDTQEGQGTTFHISIPIKKA